MKVIISFFVFAFATIATANDCVPIQRIRDWRYSGRDTVEVRVGRNESYLIRTVICPELRWADRIGFRTWPSRSPWLCEGDELVILDSMRRREIDSCMIRSILRSN
jgi:Family of unknown function (DUF6491)